MVHVFCCIIIEIYYIIFCFQVVYVTATFPYFVLIIFFFRGITLKGMSDGLWHFVTPKVKKIHIIEFLICSG